MGDILPWSDIKRLYNARLNNGKRGAGNKLARMIIGTLLIKYEMDLSDEETILAIQENPYMQYFVDFSEFADKPIFDPSLFVTIRKRLGTNDFNDMGVSLLKIQIEKYRTASQSKKNDKDDSFAIGPGFGTCTDAEVSYLTDIDLLHDGCKVINCYIAKSCKRFSLAPLVTHYKSARSAYLKVIKLKKRSKKAIRAGKSLLLIYLIRDLHSFINLIVTHGTQLFDSLNCYERKVVTAVIKMHYQQLWMFKDDTYTCADCIISIFQSHIRSIVCGKLKSPTEFGVKIDAGIVNGYTFIDHHSWDIMNLRI
ncbi:transposase [Bacteroides caecimuris]|uniref:transposase n=1 Tax=Bacteroides caecimuris TaxID=1796613 RepID=UPI00263BA955|nr:transposase [Bacteroides caecimuris]